MDITTAPKCSGIYQITHSASGRNYVGSAVNLNKRLKEHVRQLNEGCHHSKFMQRVFKKHGADSLSFKILLFCDKKNLIFFEQRAIDTIKPEFNSVPTVGSMLGYKHTPESRRKMSASRPKDFSPMTGKSHTEETKRKISKNRKGKGGTGWTDERRRKISDAMKGRVITEDQRRKISETLTGKKQSAETIEKRAQKLRGRKMPDGFAEGARQRMLGVKMSEETKVKVARAKSKLTDAQVREVRERLESGESQKSIAIMFGVDQSVISTIKTGKCYRWVV